MLERKGFDDGDSGEGLVGGVIKSRKGGVWEVKGLMEGMGVGVDDDGDEWDG